ncbi:MAG: SgcJ/EcaC family oxidoreductase [Acidobacteriota bacterium]|nr:SgcJ/EcaC family oxidoreductase [Acidobacteriota bacterium]
MRRAFIAFPLFLILSTHAVGQTTSGQARLMGKVKDEAGIRKVLADFIEAWNKHDAKAFSMAFAEDADFTNVGGKSAHGRAEVEKFHAPRFATKFKDTHLKITETKIRFIEPDVAAVDAWWEMTGAKNREGQDIPLRRGLLNFVMTSEGDKWFITVMHNMDLPAAQ